MACTPPARRPAVAGAVAAAPQHPPPPPRCPTGACAQAGIITVCCGGGGIPVAQHASGERYGMEAVVDKDEASALLGIKLQADWLLMLTGA